MPGLRRSQAILAGTVLTLDGRPPIENGGVLWQGDRIRAVGPRSEILQRRPHVLADDPNAILLPGLINSHAHLELTGLSGKIRPRLLFTDWLMRVVDEKKKLTGPKIVGDIRRGELQLVSVGVTGVADTVSLPAAFSAPRSLRTCLLPELIGLRSAVSIPSGRALSPHAPYSLSDENLSRIAGWWNTHPAAVLSMHIAESAAEEKYFLDGGGPFKEFYSRLGIAPRTVPRCRVIPHLDRYRLLRHGLVAVHANRVTAREARLLAGREITVAVCPGSMQFLGFSPCGVRRLIRASAPLLFGTDSAASNVQLNVFRELRLAKSFWRLPARVLVESATRAAGEMFWGGKTGKLVFGNFADMILVGRSKKRQDACLDLLGGRAEERIRRVVIGGKVAVNFD